MIEAMRILALDYLFDELGDKNNQPQNLEEWYHDLRNTHPERLFPFLVESGENIEKVYILEKDTEEDTVRLISEDMTGDKARWLPFMRPAGSQGAQIGPVIKRSYKKGEGGGPSVKILKTTMESFREIAGSNKLWSSYFSEIIDLLTLPQLKLMDNSVISWKEAGYENLLSCVVNKIGEQKQTVFLTVRDKDGKFPGQCSEYLAYLMGEKLAGDRYVTGSTPATDNQICPLCGASEVTVFSNALKGAGINISNADRAGAFPGIDTAQAWKGYALCNACADLLYAYNLTGRVVDYLQKHDQKEANGEGLVKILLDTFIDARLFGSSFAFKADEVKGESSRVADWKPVPKTMTGAVQFNMGEVLHKTEEVDIHGTSIFASGQEKTQGTFTTYFGLRYALIGFSGVTNEHSAEISRMSDEDYEYLLKAMWHGVRVCGNTRTKVGQMPHLLIDVEYNPGEEFQVGRLHDYVKPAAAGNKDEKAWASPEDYKIDISKLIERLNAQSSRIKQVRYASSPDLKFTGVLPSTWQTFDIETLPSKETSTPPKE